MKRRTVIPNRIRSRLLILNQHACCVCGRPDVQLHHINGAPDDHRETNLAVLCLPHHDQATAGTGLTAKLRESEITKYKANWEESCDQRMRRAARGRTSFFMVDYRNAKRLRQLFSQMSGLECQQAAEMLAVEFQEEETFRKDQRFDITTEPTTRWDSHTRDLLQFVKSGTVHPPIFSGAPAHPKDPLFPHGPVFADSRIPLYDLWCQIMARAIIAVRTPYDFGDIAKLDKMRSSGLVGCLVTYEGKVRGTVRSPDEWEEKPVCRTNLDLYAGRIHWRSTLSLNTLYVYSDTAANSLSHGSSNGLLMLRSIGSAVTRGRNRVVNFEAVPLIMGSGRLQI